MWLDDKYENLFNEDIADPDSISHSQFIFSLKDYEEHEDYELYDWNREPTPGEIEACKPHVDEIVEDFNPDGIVYLGKVATSYKNPVKAVPIEKLDLTIHRRLKRINADFAEVPIPTLELYHPAYIARMEYKLLTLKQEARKLDNFVEKLLDS